MMETKCLDLKNDCMWNGCELPDTCKMESLFKTEYHYDMFSLCNQYSPAADDLLDQLLGSDLSSGDLLTSNHNMNDIQTGQSATYYQCSASNYPANDNAMTNQLHQPAASPIKVSSSDNNGAVVPYNSASNCSHHPLNNSLNSSLSAPLSKYDPQSSSALLGSSLNNEKNGYLTNPLLTSNSANIILTQHNQTVDNSQLSLGQLNSNQIGYSTDNLNNLDISINNPSRCTDLVSCSNELRTDDCSSINCHSSMITGQSHHQLNTQNHSDYQSNHGYQTVLSQNGHMMSGNSYSFENALMDSHNYCSGVNSSVCSSNNSECSSSINPDDIEDDLDLLEDIIEEECDSGNLFSMHHADQRYSRPIAQSLESSSDVDMMESPISDSLMNDHSYGASSIEKVTPLMTNSSLTNGRQTYQPMGGRRTNGHYGSPTKSSLIQMYDEHDSIQFTKSGKRRSLASLQATANRRTIQKHHSGTSLLMKNKQAKLKKVMDIDRRKEHNESERQRRGVLKNAFSNLASRCPKLQNSNKKPSRIQTLNEATIYIRQLHDKDKSLKQAMEAEEQRKAELERKLNSLLAQ